MERPDILAIFIQGMLHFWWAVPVVLIVWVVESRWFKGKYGEFVVNRAFRKHLNPETYHLLHDVTLPTTDGSTQIDHVVVAVFGIFVIETKNMSGWIFGSANNKHWTQTFHRRKFTFQNPLRQNFKHVKSVEEVTGLPESKLHSLVIFTGSAKFKTPMPSNVTRRASGVMYILSFDQEILSAEDVSAALAAIQDVRFSPGSMTNRKHIKSLSKRSRTPVCPKCGSAMVKRRAKRGTQAGNQFWGCSAFPKCRETRRA